MIKLLIIIFLLPFSICAKEKEVQFSDSGRTWTYVQIRIHGWDIFIEKGVSQKKELYLDLKKQFENDLKKISHLIPKKPLTILRKTKIWVSNEKKYPFRANELGIIPFHRSKDWLRINGLNPYMVNGVHMINPDKVLYYHRVFEWAPMTILHELSHGYHINYLGEKNILIQNAFKRSLKNKLYESVPSRNDPNKFVKAYAITNKSEYFAELTEAYFGVNDYYPRTKKELKKYDPVGFEMIEAVWFIK